MFLSKFKIRLRPKLALSFLSAAVLVAGFSQSASASCERTVYNKSDSTWVINLGPKNTRLPSEANVKEYAAKGLQVISGPYSYGWSVIIYPNETRRIHYDDKDYQGPNTNNGVSQLSFKSYTDSPGVKGYNKTFKLHPYALDLGSGVEDLVVSKLTFGLGSKDKCGYIAHDGNTGRVTLNKPADGDIIFEPTKLGDNCVSLYTGLNGTGKKLSLCEPQHNWKDYTNLGSTGANKHSHHYAVKSFQCGSKVGYVQFMDGNKTPMPRHNESCKDGIMVNPDPWVTGYGTGVGVYK